MLRGRLPLTCALALYGIAICGAEDSWALLDNVNLPIHETGHLVCAAVGEQLAAERTGRDVK